MLVACRDEPLFVFAPSLCATQFGKSQVGSARMKSKIFVAERRTEAGHPAANHGTNFRGELEVRPSPSPTAAGPGQHQKLALKLNKTAAANQRMGRGQQQPAKRTGGSQEIPSSPNELGWRTSRELACEKPPKGGAANKFICLIPEAHPSHGLANSTLAMSSPSGEAMNYSLLPLTK